MSEPEIVVRTLSTKLKLALVICTCHFVIALSVIDQVVSKKELIKKTIDPCILPINI